MCIRDRDEGGPQEERSLVAVRAYGPPAPGAVAETERGVRAPVAVHAGRPPAPEAFVAPGTPRAG
eukprot:299715-Alexandrium_andersonii.AAC.1